MLSSCSLCFVNKRGAGALDIGKLLREVVLPSTNFSERLIFSDTLYSLRTTVSFPVSDSWACGSLNCHLTENDQKKLHQALLWNCGDAPSLVVVPTTTGRSDPQTTTPEQTIVVTVRRMCGSGFQGISTEAQDTN